jgi:hypothetical protein
LNIGVSVVLSLGDCWYYDIQFADAHVLQTDGSNLSSTIGDGVVGDRAPAAAAAPPPAVVVTRVVACQ